MLKTVKRKSQVTGGNYVIVASEYNRRYVDSMIRAAKDCLTEAKADSIKIIRVPGAYEIPVVLRNILKTYSENVSAIICLGVIIRGETVHAQLIGESVTEAITRLQIDYGVPIIHEVLLLENIQQAEKRCLDPEHNRGYEAAQTAITMVKIIKSIS